MQKAAKSLGNEDSYENAKEVRYHSIGSNACCVSKLAFVVTDYGTIVSKRLVSQSPRGVTIINATGAYTMTNKNVLICALKENEKEKFQKLILDIDKQAFMIFMDSSQIVGNGFRVYK